MDKLIVVRCIRDDISVNDEFLVSMLDEMRFTRLKDAELDQKYLTWTMSKKRFYDIAKTSINPCYTVRTNPTTCEIEYTLLGIRVEFKEGHEINKSHTIKLTYEMPNKQPLLTYGDVIGSIILCPDIPVIKKVKFNNPATIVFWEDGTKTIVKCQPGDTFDKEKGIMAAFFKKCHGNKGKFNDIIKEHIKEN